MLNVRVREGNIISNDLLSQPAGYSPACVHKAHTLIPMVSIHVRARMSTDTTGILQECLLAKGLSS